MSLVADPTIFTAPLATLREYLDLEVAQFDDHGRYVFDPEVMSEIIDALDEIEAALVGNDEESGDQ